MARFFAARTALTSRLISIHAFGNFDHFLQSEASCSYRYQARLPRGDWCEHGYFAGTTSTYMNIVDCGQDDANLDI